MDVSIKISLQGGHVWEFTCDEDNPIVFGLVSALPGASLDSALPPDGLIQVESRSGERLFLARSSLVAVAIRRLDGAALGSPAGYPAIQSTHAAPAFTLDPGFLGEAAVAALLAEVLPLDVPGGTSGFGDIALETLPPAVLDRLTESMEAAQTRLVPAASGQTHLDLRLFTAGDAVVELDLPWREGGGRLALLMHLPLAGEGASGLTVTFDEADGGVDATGRPREARHVSIEPNCALFFAPDAVRSPPRFTWGARGGRALAVCGVLRDGAGHAGG